MHPELAVEAHDVGDHFPSIQSPLELDQVAVGVDGDDRVGLDGILESGGRVEGEDLAVVHDGHPVAQLVGLFHVVGGQEDRLALAVEALEDLPQGEAALGVEPGRGLVEEQDRRPMQDGAGDHEPLSHAARQRVDGCLPPLRQLEHVEQEVGGGPGFLARHAEEATVVEEVLPHVQGAVQRVLLRHHADHLLRQRRVGDDVDPRHVGLAARRDHPGGEHPGRGRLARSVRAEEPEDLAGPDGQVEGVDRLEVGTRIDLGQVDGPDHLPVARRAPRLAFQPAPYRLLAESLTVHVPHGRR